MLLFSFSYWKYSFTLPVFSVVFANVHVVLLTTQKSRRAEKKFHNARSLQENNARSAANQRAYYCSHIINFCKALAKRRRKLKTWVNLRLRLASARVHLCWLAMTCAHFGRDQICTQVDASFSPFGHPTQVNASWATSINLLSANKIEVSLP